MLELGDPELELVYRLSRRDTELGGEARRPAFGAFGYPAGFAAPALDDVGHGRANLVTLDTEPTRQLVGEIVGALRSQRKSAEPGQGHRLERTAVSSGTGHAASMHAADGGVLASTTASASSSDLPP